MRDRFVAVTTAALDDDPRLAVVLAAISATQFAPARRRHPGRVVDVGIREQLMIGVTAGMALEGLRPVVHSYAPFLLERPLESLKVDLAHQGAGALLVSIGGSYDEPGYGRTHACPEDVALLDALGGWTVHVPGHPDEVAPLLADGFARDDRVYVRLSTQTNAAAHHARPGPMTTLRTGTWGTVLAVGPMLDRTAEAVEQLDVTLLYASTVRPFDGPTLRRTLGATGVVVVEPLLAGTSVPAVSHALRDLPHRVLGLGVGQVDLHRYGTAADHDRAHGLDAGGIRRAVQGFLPAA